DHRPGRDLQDDDRPSTAVEDLIGTLLATAEGIDLEGDEGGVEVTAAAAAWLATNPAEANGHERDHVVREGVRIAYKGKPPEQVEAWRAGGGIGCGRGGGSGLPIAANLAENGNLSGKRSARSGCRRGRGSRHSV